MGVGKSRKLVTSFTVLVILFFSLMAGVAVYAQVSGATLSGTVTDASGSAVPNATVSIKNGDTGIIREITTDGAGFYSVPNLPPAVYEVKTTAAGFSTQTQSGITLTVGAQQTLNFSLKVGQMAENVTVTGEAPQVELTSSALSGEVNETTVRELPLNGRDWSSLSVLEPGVIGIRTQQTTTGTVNRGNRGFGNQLSVAGHRPTENNYRVNGITVNDYSNGSPGSVQGSQLGVDAIQEFSVLTANYTAEYGRTSGGVINAITKAGTNTFHGDAYWFLRDEGLDARNEFDPSGVGTPPFHRNQFGGSAGGPVQKGKTFIFGDFEAIRQTKDLSGNSTVPSAAARGNPDASGNPTTVAVVGGSPLPASGPGAALDPDPISHISLLVEPYLKLFPMPTPGLPLNPGGDTGQFLAGIPITFSEDYATARVDHHFSDKDDIDAVWFFDRGPQFAPDVFLLSTTETFSERIMGGIEETHIFSPTLVNTARAGYNRTVGFVGEPGTALTPAGGDTSLSDGFLPDHPAPILTGTGLATMQGTLGDQTLNRHFANSFQFDDDAFYTHGNHAIKFGFSVERIQYNEFSVQRPNGTFSFQGSLDSFLINDPASFQQGDSAIGKELGTRTTFLAGYIQDNWKFRPNLTLNLGLRYEIATLPTDSNGPFAVVPSPNISAPPIDVIHPWQTNPTRKDFEPRIGFAWDPFNNGKTSVRGGFGIFDILPGPWVLNIQESGSYPFALTPAVGNLAQGDFPNVPGLNPSTAIPSAQAYAPDQNPKRNYAMNWNLTIQRQITPNLTATLGYVGSHTLHSPFTTDTSNSVGPAGLGFPGTGGVVTTPLGMLWPCGPDGTPADGCAVGFLPTGTQGAPLPSLQFNSNVGQLRPTFWDDSASYSGMEAQLSKRFSHGLQGEASFTWSKCMDHGSSGDIGDAYQNSYSSEIFFDPGSRNGPCDFNVGKNFVANLIWDVPVPKSDSWAVSHLASGWELGGILTASTGTPFTVDIGGDPIDIKNGDSMTYPDRLPNCNPINSNWKTTLQYVNLSCFAAPYAPMSFVGCASNSYPGASLTQLPAGMQYCQNLFGDNGRNSLTGPGLMNLDFMVFKNNYIRRISESFNAQFRAEIFNILNHPNYLPPIDNETLFSSNGALASGNPGKLDTTGGFESRQIQLSLKMIW